MNTLKCERQNVYVIQVKTPLNYQIIGTNLIRSMSTIYKFE